MGKGRHTQDKMYITAKEWSQEMGGAKDRRSQKLKTLPFSCCSLSMGPFENPVMTADGSVFELTQM